MEHSGNYTFDDIKLGQAALLEGVWTEEKMAIFSAISGDHVPDDIKGSEANVGCHIWLGSLLSHLLGNKMPGLGTIYVSQRLNFLTPIRLGDTIKVTTTVSAKGSDGCTVELNCVARNQQQEVVLGGMTTVLAPKEKCRL